MLPINLLILQDRFKKKENRLIKRAPVCNFPESTKRKKGRLRVNDKKK